MDKFLFIYHGGKQPESETEVQSMIAAWGSWLGSLDNNTIDSGNPVGESSTVMSDGSVVDNGGANPASGYGIFEAESLEKALEMAKGCPIINDGGSVEVAQIHEVSL